MFPSVEVGGCLVLVELGTNAGFQIIAEARDFLRQVSAQLSGISTRTSSSRSVLCS